MPERHLPPTAVGPFGAAWNTLRRPGPVVLDERGVHLPGRRARTIPWEDIVDVVPSRIRVQRWLGWLGGQRAECVPTLLLRNGRRIHLDTLPWSPAWSYAERSPLDEIVAFWIDLATTDDGVATRGEPDRARLVRRHRLLEGAAVGGFAVAVAAFLVVDAVRGSRSDELDDRAGRADRTNAQILAAYSGRDRFADLVASGDPFAAVRVIDARRTCGGLDAFDVDATIVDPGGTQPATITVAGRGLGGDVASCTIEAYWVRWCAVGNDRRCNGWDGAWVRSPAEYWSDIDLGELQLWLASAWPVPAID